MNKKWLLFFLVLFALGWIYFESRPVKHFPSYQTDLIRLDTSAISLISIHWKDTKQEFFLKRETAGWIVSDGTRSAQVLPERMQQLLAGINRFPTDRAATQLQQQWADFGVDASQGLYLEVFEGLERQAAFHLGRSLLDSMNRAGLAFLRMEQEQEVYEISGRDWMVWNADFDSYRRKELLNLPLENIHFVVVENRWDSVAVPVRLLRGEAGVSDYLNSLAALKGSVFADGFDPQKAAEHLFFKLDFQGPDTSSVAALYCYRDTLTDPPFVFYSSQFPTNYFTSDSSGLFQRVWQERPSRQNQ